MMGYTVANVIYSFNSASGGPPRVVSSIAAAGIGLWNSELITTDFCEPTGDSLLTGDFSGKVRLLNGTSHGRLGQLFAARWQHALDREIQRLPRPAVLHLHGLWNPLLARCATIAEQNGIPYIVAPHGMLEPWALNEGRLRKSIALRIYQRRVLRQAAGIHATSETEARQIRRLGLTQAPIWVVPNAIDLPSWSERSAQPARRVLLFLSRLHPKKGLDLLLDAWRDFGSNSGWVLRIVGHGEPRFVNALRQRCQQEQLVNVEFHPHLDGERKEAMFSSADAFVLPTYSENFGNVVAEAMIRGLPVITTTGTPWSVIAEKHLRWYIEPTYPALTSALAELFACKAESLLTMGELARKFALDNFVLDAVRPRLHAMYNASIDG